MIMRKPTLKGFAIATLLMMIPLILLMVGALFAHLRSGSQWSGSRYGTTAAQYVSEAGAQHSVQQLRAAGDWVGGFTDQPMASGKGSYTVVFNQTKTGFQPHHSVNNFDGDHADSPLGPGTVPNGAALIAVEGKVGAHSKLSYYLVGTGDDTIRVEQAILTTGKIEMEGETKLTAVESLAEKGTLDALVHSNDDSGASDLITWQPGTNGGNLLVEGEVKSSGSSSSAIDLSGYTPTNGSTTNAAKQAIPPAGIETKVFAKRGATTFPGGNSVPNGDNYYDATITPLVVNGDLVLDGDLYVEGDIQINGSIVGNGSVYVTGDSELFGDASITGNSQVSLLSHGNVTLRGFDGDAYLDSIGDSTFQAQWAETKAVINELEVEMAGGNWVGNNSSRTNYLLDVLGNTDRPQAPSGYTQHHTLSKMRTHINNTMPVGPTKQFMLDKLNLYSDLFGVSVQMGKSDAQIRDDFWNNGETFGIIDAANDLNDTDLKKAAYNLVRQVKYDKLGSSYFQGLIYTNGGFYADNQVTVLGAVVVNDDGSQSSFVAPSGDTVDPGDLVLKSGSNITYVKEFFFGPNAGGTTGPARILLHLGNG